MKGRIRRFPIQRKVRLVVLATCTAALCVASLALFVLQFYFLQREFRRDVAAIAEIVASHCTEPLRSNDPRLAEQTLSSLRPKSTVVGAALLRGDGSVLARFGDVTVPVPGAAEIRPGFDADGQDLVGAQPVMLADERLGWLILHANDAQQAGRLHRLYASILLGVLALSFLVAIFVSSKLERLIFAPIENLAGTARRITTEKDYSVRATKVAEDELGLFTDSFNNMLDQIQARDNALVHEIAERKRAEQELQQAQAQLMNASRQAGMAEVATGVLHNVGNVLNSVNVSASLIAERLGKSRTAHLARAAAMLREKSSRLADFLANDPKGKLLPGYLADLSEQLENERQATRREVDLLTRNIEHIMDIVAMQQTYARVSRMAETVPVETLIEQALELDSARLAQHHINVKRDFAAAPPVRVDQHKALQILVNLFQNAEHSMDEANPAEKILTIRVRQKDEKTATIAVVDNGTGIAPENLTSIFSHGFTTRRRGHGFGLHSAALTAQQMGGHLSAQSDGPGHGATFTLELPLAAPTAT